VNHTFRADDVRHLITALERMRDEGRYLTPLVLNALDVLRAAEQGEQ